MRLTNKTMRRGNNFSYPIALLLLLLKISLAQDNCTEQCDGGSCVQRNISTECRVVCNNTGVTNPAGSCQSSIFDHGTVDCIAGACRYTDFTDSNVTCAGDGDTCGLTTFNRSNVACFSNSCSGAHFHSSAVTCDAYASCPSAWFYACSCCNGYSCHDASPSCTEDPVAFCDTKYLGRNCQEWGNPVCVGLIIGTFMLRVEK